MKGDAVALELPVPLLVQPGGEGLRWTVARNQCLLGRLAIASVVDRLNLLESEFEPIADQFLDAIPIRS